MESPKTHTQNKSSCLCGLKKKSPLITLENADSIIQQADDYLQSLVNDKIFSGSVLIARNDQILILKGYGCAEYICQEKNTSQTIYRIGSVTKPLTAIIVLKLHERKQLDIKNKISLYYPDYPHGNEITIKNLLSNTSGIFNYTDLEIFEQKCTENLTIDQLIEVFKSEPLQFKPGSEYSYSNSNYILLGLIIEKVTGKSYESNLREIILEPCLMNDTGYECDCDFVSNTKHTQRAYGYTCDTNTNIFESCRFINMSTARSAGGIHSTVEDLYRLDRYLYGEKLIQNPTKKLMFKPVREHYALGWEIHRLKHGKVKQQHFGEIFGFISCLIRFPNDNACIIVLSNLEGTSMHEIADTLSDILFQEK
ncbi:unnamed protein product [Rotaria socialis]|uniref:Beta-lactamase-related domain-containing protein n=1 Tax=Rotaria socialis TaxID=392032 RepID=A0A818CD07_9BILA|nr:unnamed protein product [Rotaria socialis]CAF3343122.1 unnamed protein product [Rotaria socialis]CAF3418920.1 unnamed protein product [Rotaria socialis]CAF3429372.1 unnamed protein product [Rotaria socialis]CAF4101519.1 unnamed protein product [Rotaria socialis]